MRTLASMAVLLFHLLRHPRDLQTSLARQTPMDCQQSAWSRQVAGAAHKERLKTARGTAPEALSYEEQRMFETYRPVSLGSGYRGRLLAGSLRRTREAVKQGRGAFY